MSFLVIGGGKMGLSHLAILNRLLDAGQVAVCDPSRLSRFVYGRLGVRSFASLDAALDCGTKWSGAVVASPTATHFPIARRLLERDIPCFVEKPLTLDPQKSEALIALQRERGVVAQMGLVLRFAQPFVRLREIVRSGVLGKPLQYHARMLGNVVTRPDNGSWRTDFSRGGGCLNEYGPHLLDLCRFVFGDVAALGSASFGRVHSTRADDSADIAWRHADGTPGTLRLDWCDTTRRKSHTDFEVRFEHGLVQADTAEIHVQPDEGPVLDETQRMALCAPVLPYPVSFYLRGEEYTLQLEAFVERVTGRRLMRTALGCGLAADLADGCAVDRLIREIAQRGGQA